jgi:hypothetical protein
VNRKGNSHQPETRAGRLTDSLPQSAKKARCGAAKPAVEQPNPVKPPLSISAQFLGTGIQDIEISRICSGIIAEREHAPKSLATFACRHGVDRIQPAASGKWGEVPVFDISRIEMTMFNDVTPPALKRKSAPAPQARARRTASEISDFSAFSAAKVVRQISSSPAEANKNALVRSATR